jgi:hypothetical protein
MKICPKSRVQPRMLRGAQKARVQSPKSRRRGYLMSEALVYIGLVFVVLGVGYAALYRCIDNSVVLRRNADDIAHALRMGELWRADVRSAKGQIRFETNAAEQFLRLPRAQGEVAYRSSENTLFRRLGAGPWVPLLTNVKSSGMAPDPRQNVTAWRWELELRTRAKASARASRVVPLFTFVAVPGMEAK